MQDQKKRPATPGAPEVDKKMPIPPTMIDTSELEDKLKKAEREQKAPKRRPCCCC